MSDSSVNISKNAVITYKEVTKSWTTQIVKAGSHECITLDPRNRGLVQLIVEQCGFSLDQADLKRMPSLAHVRGMLELKDARNLCQANSLVLNEPQARQLFERTEASQQKKLKRSREQIGDMRSEGKLFQVELPGGKIVWLQRPIYQSDGIIAWLDTTNVETILQFIVENGLVKEDLFTRREYRASGVRGSWKFKAKGKDYTYAKTNGQWQRQKDNDATPIADEQESDPEFAATDDLQVVDEDSEH